MYIEMLGNHAFFGCVHSVKCFCDCACLVEEFRVDETCKKIGLEILKCDDIMKIRACSCTRKDEGRTKNGL